MTARSGVEGSLRLPVTVRAAGGLVIRAGADGHIRLAVIHRAGSDDWSYPKGRLRRGETALEAAVREVREETGLLCMAEILLGRTEYVDRRGRRKRVTYWAMNPLAGGFTPGNEVDGLQWLRPAEARLRLTRDHDRTLLDASLAVLVAAVEARDQPQVRTSS